MRVIKGETSDGRKMYIIITNSNESKKITERQEEVLIDILDKKKFSYFLHLVIEGAKVVRNENRSMKTREQKRGKGGIFTRERDQKNGDNLVYGRDGYKAYPENENENENPF